MGVFKHGLHWIEGVEHGPIHYNNFASYQKP
jgi:hypothetical protein